MRAVPGRSSILLPALAALFLAAPPGDAGLCQAMATAGPLRGTLLLGGQDIAYGRHPRQRLSFWAAPGPASGQSRPPTPLLLFVHGGGWKRGDRLTGTGRAKVSHFLGRGTAFASMNYRLVPAATVEQQAADVASAVAWLIRHSERLGIDPRRLVLMGHSAGAHLVALVGTDPSYLRAVGLDASAVAGVVPIDGAAYDVPMQLRTGAPALRETYAQAFGSDPARQRALSPTFQAMAPNAPSFLLLHVRRPDATTQARGLARALRQAGTPVRIAGFEGVGLQGHIAINRQLGTPGDPATQVVDDWLRGVFGR